MSRTGAHIQCCSPLRPRSLVLLGQATIFVKLINREALSEVDVILKAKQNDKHT